DPDQLTNTATVHYHPTGFTNDITDSDDHLVDLFQPAVTIVKTGTELSKIGDPVTYTYTVTNTGSADSPALENVVVVDDGGDGVFGNGNDFTPTGPSGDDGDGLLEKGETWTYTATRTVPAGASDPFVNVAKVTAKAVGSVFTTSDTDDHSVNLFQ